LSMCNYTHWKVACQDADPQSPEGPAILIWQDNSIPFTFSIWLVGPGPRPAGRPGRPGPEPGEVDCRPFSKDQVYIMNDIRHCATELSDGDSLLLRNSDKLSDPPVTPCYYIW